MIDLCFSKIDTGFLYRKFKMTSITNITTLSIIALLISMKTIHTKPNAVHCLTILNELMRNRSKEKLYGHR